MTLAGVELPRGAKLFLWLAAANCLVDGQRFTFHPNISFRGPQQLWVRLV